MFTESKTTDEYEIVFASFRGGDFSSSIHAISPDGTGERQLSSAPNGLPGSLDPGVTVDGSTIVFGRGSDGTHRTSVWTMDFDGSNEVRRSDWVMVRFNNGRTWPSLRPGTEQILYVAELSRRRTLILSDLDGSGRDELGLGEFPSFSPDGSRLAFMRDKVVTVLNLDSREEREVGLRGDDYPSWSPDGTQLLISRSAGENADLFLVNLADGSEERITNTPDVSEKNAVLSPDGEMIAFRALSPNAPQGWENSIFVMDASPGSEAKEITDSRHNDTRPSWHLKR